MGVQPPEGAWAAGRGLGSDQRKMSGLGLTKQKETDLIEIKKNILGAATPLCSLGRF